MKHKKNQKGFRHFMLSLPVLIALVLLACQPEDISSTLDSSSVFTSNPQSVSALTQNAQDKEEVVINEALYAIGMALKDHALGEGIQEFVWEGNNDGQQGVVRLSELVEKFPSLQKTTSGMLNQYATLSYEGIFKMERAGIVYEPVVHIPNRSNANEGVHPVISPGLELDANQHPELEDYISGWDLSASPVVEIVISEAEALQTEQPLWVVSLQPIDVQVPTVYASQGLSNGGYEPSANKVNAIVPLKITKLKPVSAFEGSGKSEIWAIDMALAASSGFPTSVTSNMIYDFGNGHGVVWEGDQVINTSKLSTTHTFSGFNAVPLLEYNTMDPNPANHIFNLYERDWYANYQPVGSLVSAGLGPNPETFSWNIEGRMKFFNEVYIFNTFSNNQNSWYPEVPINVAGIYNFTKNQYDSRKISGAFVYLSL